MKRCNLNRLY